MALLNGIDVSSHQPAGVAGMVPADFVIVKATGGTWYRNTRMTLQLGEAVAARVPRLATYHFAHEGAKQSARLEAEAYLKASPAVLPVLDWEDGDVSDTAWAAEWCRIVQAETGLTPLLYCNLSVATSYDWSAVRSLGVRLWLAYYGNDAQVNGYAQGSQLIADVVRMVWDGAALWQYTQHGRLPGYAADLDLNVAYEDVWAGDRELLIDGVDGPVRGLYRP